MTKYLVEVRASVQRTGSPRLVPLDEVAQHTGFRTIVAYDEATVALIRERGGTYDMRNYEVYADTLFMDFDGHDPGQFREWLKSSGLAYTEWDSGGRSVHFHIPLVPVFGNWVTSAMRDWTKRHAPTADTSFLHNAGCYRLPGTYHKRNAGRCKELVAEQGGSSLALSQPERTSVSACYSDGGSREKFYTMLLTPKGEGHRSSWLWYLATLAAEAGLEYDEALEKLTWWNMRMTSSPQDPLRVQQQCESAYRRLARRQA